VIYSKEKNDTSRRADVSRKRAGRSASEPGGGRKPGNSSYPKKGEDLGFPPEIRRENVSLGPA